MMSTLYLAPREAGKRMGFVTGQVPLMGVASKDRDRANESSSKLNGQLWPIKEGRGTKGVGPGDGFAARTDTL